MILPGLWYLHHHHLLLLLVLMAEGPQVMAIPGKPSIFRSHCYMIIIFTGIVKLL